MVTPPRLLYVADDDLLRTAMVLGALKLQLPDGALLQSLEDVRNVVEHELSRRGYPNLETPVILAKMTVDRGY